MKAIALSQIRIDGGTQTRVSISSETVSDYCEAVLAGAQFPPVDVFFDGIEYWLADGFHRYHAHRKAGVSDIIATVHTGTVEAALIFALKANATHALRRTNEDKRNCVRIALKMFADRSDRVIAEMCAVGAPMVGKAREESNCNNVTVPRTGADGKTRKAPTPRPKDPENTEHPTEDQNEPSEIMPQEEISPEEPAQKEEKLTITIDQGIRIWSMAKMTLDTIAKDDASRVEALNEAINYCNNRIKNKK